MGVESMGEAYVKLMAQDETAQPFANLKANLQRVGETGFGQEIRRSGRDMREMFVGLSGMSTGLARDFAGLATSLLEGSAAGLGVGVAFTAVNWALDKFNESSKKAAEQQKRFNEAIAEGRKLSEEMAEAAKKMHEAVFQTQTAGTMEGMTKGVEAQISAILSARDRLKAGSEKMFERYSSKDAGQAEKDWTKTQYYNMVNQIQKADAALEILKRNAKDLNIGAALRSSMLDALGTINNGLDAYQQKIVNIQEKYAKLIETVRQNGGTEAQVNALLTDRQTLLTRAAMEEERAQAEKRRQLEEQRRHELESINKVDAAMRASQRERAAGAERGKLTGQVESAMKADKGPMAAGQDWDRSDQAQKSLQAFDDEQRRQETRNRLAADYKRQIEEVNKVLYGSGPLYDEEMKALQDRITGIERERDYRLQMVDQVLAKEIAARDQLSNLEKAKTDAERKLKAAEAVKEQHAEMTTLDALRTRLQAAGASAGQTSERQQAIDLAKQNVKAAEKLVEIQSEALTAAKKNTGDANSLNVNGV
jgi:DNA-binding ferritin-like protein (Dps family)